MRRIKRDLLFVRDVFNASWGFARQQHCGRDKGHLWRFDPPRSMTVRTRSCQRCGLVKEMPTTSPSATSNGCGVVVHWT